MANERAPMKTVLGKVVSDKMDKTISVREERMVKHRRYGKYIRRSSIYKAHDEQNSAREGDHVEILFTRPQSKTKNWRLLRIVRRAHSHVAPTEVGKSEVQAVVTPAKQAPDGAPDAPDAPETAGEEPTS